MGASLGRLGNLPATLPRSSVAGCGLLLRVTEQSWRSIHNIAAARAVDREFNYNFGSNLGRFGSGRGSNGRGAPVGFIWAEFQLKRSHGDPFHAQNNCLCAASSNSGAPGSQEISPLTSRTALEQCSVSWGSHLSRFCFEQRHGDLFRDQNVPHIELKLFLNSSLFVFSLLSMLFFIVLF